MEPTTTPFLLILSKLQELRDLAKSPPAEFLSVKDAAAVLALSSTKLIRKAIKSGELCCFNVGGRRPTNRISRRDFDEWVEAKRLRRGPAKAERQALVRKFWPTAA